MVELLLKKGVNVNIRDYEFGQTALMNAVICNNIKLVELLVNNGVDLNIKDNNGETALIHAIKKQISIEKDIMKPYEKKLLENLKIENQKVKKNIERIFIINNNRIIKRDNNLEIINLLIEKSNLKIKVANKNSIEYISNLCEKNKLFYKINILKKLREKSN